MEDKRPVMAAQYKSFAAPIVTVLPTACRQQFLDPGSWELTENVTLREVQSQLPDRRFSVPVTSLAVRLLV